MNKTKLLITVLFLVGVVITRHAVFAQGEGNMDTEKINKLQEQIKEAEEKLNETRQRKNTLASEINYINSQIYLTNLKIGQAEEEVNLLQKQLKSLTAKIDQLDNSLTETAQMLYNRVVATYKAGAARQSASFYLLLSSRDFTDFLRKSKNLQTVQAYDKKLMYAIQSSKNSFQKQKTLREEKKAELEELQIKLEGQKQILAQQTLAKKSLLEATKNDEKKYQQLLSTARAELEAIQAIIAGKGDEEEVGNVNEGDRIASVIGGSSCNSSGTHLHFIVSEGGVVKNPFSFLGSINHINCSGPGSCSEADSFSPSGSWRWPLEPQIRFYQGYGPTWAVANSWVGRIYNFHNGIDVGSESSNDVKAVKSGKLYKGSYSGGGGCRLRYVRVDHDEGNLETYYLHINY